MTTARNTPQTPSERDMPRAFVAVWTKVPYPGFKNHSPEEMMRWAWEGDPGRVFRAGQAAERASSLAAMEAKDRACICEGNWRKIVAESEPLIGQTYIRDGDENHTFRFMGVLHAEDDYYYVMGARDGTVSLLSCCSNPEGHGYSRKDAEIAKLKERT